MEPRSRRSGLPGNIGSNVHAVLSPAIRSRNRFFIYLYGRSLTALNNGQESRQRSVLLFELHPSGSFLQCCIGTYVQYIAFTGYGMRFNVRDPADLGSNGQFQIGCHPNRHGIARRPDTFLRGIKRKCRGLSSLGNGYFTACLFTNNKKGGLPGLKTCVCRNGHRYTFISVSLQRGNTYPGIGHFYCPEKIGGNIKRFGFGTGCKINFSIWSNQNFVILCNTAAQQEGKSYECC